MKQTDETILREAVRRILKEEMYDYNVSPWVGPYGIGKGASKHGKTSMGTYGGSLYGIFIQPFVDAATVVGAELGQTGVRLVSLLRTVIESALEALLPKFKANYDNIQKSQAKYIDKIKDKYESAYKAVDEAWEHEDIQFFSFMHSPTAWVTYKAITAKPQAILSVYEALAEGNSIMLNYLRDIRNRMYGAPHPGAGISSGPMAMPAARPATTESCQLREGDKITKTIDFQGLDVKIDRPVGFVQKGKNGDGEEWEREYLFDYGFIKGTEGGDGEEFDVFVGPDSDAPNVYIVTQKKSDGSFDEYKAFLGFASEDDALEAYEDHIPVEHFDSVVEMPIGALKGFLGVDPDVTLGEAAPAKPKTPAEQVADALTDPKFIQMVQALPIIKQMKQDADVINQQTAAGLQRAMAPVLNADTSEDLVRASGGSWQPPAEYAKLKPEEKAETDEVLVTQAKASMAAYYMSRINELVKQATDLGVADNSPYVASLKQQLATLAKYKG